MLTGKLQPKGDLKMKVSKQYTQKMSNNFA